MTVGGELGRIARHPARFLATQWNWKAALLSAIMRGVIFFTSTLSVGTGAAIRALIVDATFRVPMAGVCAALVQALRWAEPRWLGATIMLLGIPMASHAVEIALHAAAATPLLSRAVARSIVLSIASSAVELVLMRRDLMIVGPGAGSLSSDLRRVLRFTRTSDA